MKQPIKVVMLPTEGDIAPLWLYSENRIEMHCLNESLYKETPVPQHLYITVSQEVEKPKEGDWCIIYTAVYKTNFLVQYQEGKYYHRFRDDGKSYNTEEEVNGRVKKIIATDDPKLTIECTLDNCYHDGMNGCYGTKSIPQVQQSFLKEFIANPNGEFEVEYFEHNHPDLGVVDCTLKLNQDNEVNISTVKKCICNLGIDNHRVLPITGDNCMHCGQVIKDITSVEEKMYSLEQMRLSWKEGYNSAVTSINNDRYDEDYKVLKFEDWIKENL